MSDFFDTFKDIGGGKYVGAAEKAELIDGGIPIEITDVVFQAESKYGARYVCRVLLPDFEEANGEPEERLMSFSHGTVESRDRLLEAMSAYLEEVEATPPVVRLERAGQAILIVKA